MPKKVRIAVAAAAMMASLGFGAANAEPIPKGWLAKNMEPLGFYDMGGRLAFKLTIKHKGNKWYLFTGYTADDDDNGRPGELLVFDVTDPRNPILVNHIPGPKNTDMGQVSLHGDLLITSLQRRLTTYDTTHPMNFMAEFAKPKTADMPFEEGITLWDVSDPANPKKVGRWETGAYGTHRNSYPGGKYAYISSSRVGFKGMQLVILDVSNPAKPVEVGSWAQLGQQEGEKSESGLIPSYHGPSSVSPDGKMLTLGYTPYVVNLDISDIAHPKLIGKLEMVPPFAYNVTQSVHTVLPFWNRKLLYVNGEPKKANCDEPLPLQAMVDNSNPAAPRMISVFPVPRPPVELKVKNFCDRPGRFGPHNISTEIHNPDVEHPNNIIHVAYFNAGMQVYDISDARIPTLVGYFIPPDSPSPTRSQSGMLKTYIAQDTLSDTRGYVYMVGSGGLYVLRDTKGMPPK